MMILSITQLLFCDLVIYFDGSLRVPKDPNPSFGSNGIRRVASCAVTFINDEEDRILAMSAKTLPLTLGITSADVEYEGLIYALNTLLDCLLKDDTTTTTTTTTCSKNIIIGQIGSTIRVRGDCKTVMDHMNNEANPRKQRIFFEAAKDIMNKIHTAYNSDKLNHNPQLKFEYEHVLRDKNVICDLMCQHIVSLVQMKIIPYILYSIEEANENAKLSPKKFVLPMSKAKRLSFSKSHFSNPLNLLSDTSGIVSYSQRPYFLFQLAKVAIARKDFPAIRMIGRAIQQESSRSNRDLVVVLSTDTYEVSLNHLGILLEVHALKNLDLHREAMKLEKKIIPQSIIQHEPIDIFDKISEIVSFPSQNVLPSLVEMQSKKSCELKNWNSAISEWYLFLHERENNSMDSRNTFDENYDSDLSIHGILFFPQLTDK